MPQSTRRATKIMDKVARAVPRPAEPDFGITKNSHRAMRKLLRQPVTLVGVGIFVIVTLACLFAFLIAPYDPTAIDMTSVLKPPSLEHLLGTDRTGRDVLSRILFGGQVSIAIGLGSAVGAAILGTTLGLLAGYRGGWLDSIVLRASELFMAFPQIIVVLLLVSIVGQSALNLVIIFVATGWGSIYRMARSVTLSIREEEFVMAQRALGIRPLVICFKEILPNAIGPIAVNITLSTAMFILQESSLSFLGLGVPMETPTWGNILNAANDLRVLRDAWWLWLPVGAVIAAFVLSINLIGDGLRDSTDPNLQG